MGNNPKVRDIKHAQRESFLLREVSESFLKIALDDAKLNDFYVTQVKLSPSRGHCEIFFHTPRGPQAFRELLSTLILYKPSIRTALSKALQGRYTPDLTFVYDDGIDKQNKMEDLFRKLEEEGKL